jgi:hypothetical protein
MEKKCLPIFLRSKTALLSAQEGPNETNLHPPQAG